MADEEENEGSVKSLAKPSFLGDQGFAVVKVIGHGTFSKVKLATATEHQDAPVAIKIINKQKVPSDFLTKFLTREMEIARKINHPNLITFYQSMETNFRCYLVMEYCPRGSLLDKIKKEERLIEYYARLYYKQLLDGLAYLHSNGIAHRDIKCENILFDAENNLKLIDFGFAKDGLQPGENGETEMSSTYCGSLAYASPEVLKGIPYNPIWSDIWASGVILYAMVFGYLPYNDNNLPRLIKQVQSKLVFPSKIEVSKEVKALLPKILAKLDHRYDIVHILNDDWTLKEEEPPPRKSELEEGEGEDEE